MSAQLFPHQFQPDVLHIRLDLELSKRNTRQLNPEEQGELLDTLAAWCDAEQLFIGGSLANMVVYAPLKPITPQQMQSLRRLILSQPGVAGCQMKLLLLSYLQSIPEKAACLEAFSQAQRYLAEKLAEGADALALLAPAGPRSWRGLLGQDGLTLSLQHVQLQISLTLIPLGADKNEKPILEFSRFDKQIVSLSELQAFIPDWLDLHWTKVPQHPEADLSVGRWQAEGHGFQLWITGLPSARLTHREVMLRWMGAVAVT